MKLNIFFIFLGFISVIFIYRNVKNNLNWEKDSIMWIFGAVLILILSAFPDIIDGIAYMLKIYYPPSLLFLVTLLFLLSMVFRQSKQISLINEKNKELAQSIAILEKTISKIKDRGR